MNLAAIDRATAGVDGPLLALDEQAWLANAHDLERRADGTPIRVATKSVRVRHVIEQMLARPGVIGAMTYSLREALWLSDHGHRDLLMGYPSVDRGALAELGASPVHRASVTLMVDGAEQLRIAAEQGATGAQVCLDVDASLRIGRAHLGVRRSPLRTPQQVTALAREAVALGFRVRGVMFYEAQIAGLPDTSAAVRWVKRRSAAELAVRRAGVVAAVQDAVGALDLVNSGGSGSVALSAGAPAVTEVTAGSGLFVPTLFDHYRSFTPRPALFFALPVVRRPVEGTVTAFGGGYIASGPAGANRVPTPVWPTGLGLLRTEGAGEVQTPVRRRRGQAVGVGVGDRVWFRHAKAGEVCERFEHVHVVGADTVTVVPTYRGEGRCFG